MIDLEGELGPKMLALTSFKQRRFVTAYVSNGGNALQAAKMAGYDGVKMAGFRLLQQEKIQLAMREICEKELGTLTPSALKGMRDLLNDPNHKDHAKAVFGVLDRTGFHVKTEHKQVVEHLVDDSQLVSAITALAQELGLPPERFLGSQAPKALPAPIEAEYQEVEGDGSEGLEDLL